MDTIYALSSGGVPAGIAIVRISGPGVSAYVASVFPGGVVPRAAKLRAVRDPETAEVLDRGLVLFFPGPASYTGEDLLELHLHGSPAVVAGVVGSLGRQPGFRQADPGEFTRRAVSNGKLDLTAAEGLADLIAAETDAQRRVALAQSGGVLARAAEGWRDRILDLLARVEAELDFSDEGDVDPLSARRLAGGIVSLRDEIEGVVGSARAGERIRQGLQIAVVGPPNAGKSSLVNRLAARSVAIVTDIPGTTRDVLETPLDVGGYPVSVFDTAGIRQAEEPIEAEGVDRARATARSADLVLHLADRAQRRGGARFKERVGGPVWEIETKADESGESDAPNGVDLCVSSVTGAGFDSLLKRIEAICEPALDSRGMPLLTRERQRAALSGVSAALARACDDGLPDEVIAEHLRDALGQLARLTGHVGVEAVLDRIFSEFCIGK